MGFLKDVAGDVLGSAVQGLFGQSSAREQMDFQKMMSNTAYTRAAKDLERAGLNRVLALGSPASTPSGAMAQIDAPKLSQTGAAVASARQQREQSKAEINMLREQEKLVQADVETREKQQSLMAAQELKEKALETQAISSAKEAEARTYHLQLQNPELELKKMGWEAGLNTAKAAKERVDEGMNREKGRDLQKHRRQQRKKY